MLARQDAQNTASSEPVERRVGEPFVMPERPIEEKKEEKEEEKSSPVSAKASRDRAPRVISFDDPVSSGASASSIPPRDRTPKGVDLNHCNCRST